MKILSATGRVPKALAAEDRYLRWLRGVRYWRRGRSGKRGTIYARFSSRYQHSIADQIRVCREWAQANGIDVADRHIFFDEKTTGKKNRRAGFQAMMQAVVANEVDVVIIFTTSRLFRKTYRSLRFVEEEVVDRSKRCVFVKSGIDTADTENWRKLLHLHSLVDEMQITMAAAHIRAAHEGQLRMGQKSIDPTLPQQIADRVMALCDQGRLYAEIAAELNVDHTTLTAAVRHWHTSRGLPVPDGRSRRKSLQRKSRSPAPDTADSA